jgi:hypothetical protein
VPLLALLTSLVAVVAAYLYVSVREGTYINALTPMYVIMIPTEYLLDLYHLAVFGPSASGFAYAMSYGSYAIYTVSLGLTYTLLKVPSLRLPFDAPNRPGTRFVAYFVLLGAAILYLPVVIKFRHDLADPREIYTQTRVGYGQYFLLSIAFIYLALILLLFSRRAKKFELSIFMLFSLVLTWLQGSKGHMLGLFFILALYFVYVRDIRIRFFKFFGIAIVTSVFGLGLFLLTTPALLLNGGLRGLSNYSSYTRNAMLVIDSGIGPLYGKLNLEDQIYPRIPRIIDPNKPRDYGDFYLAKRFFPTEFAENVGAPAFGDGLWFADFHIFALPILMVLGILAGALLKMCARATCETRTPGAFILMLFAAGMPLIPISGTFLLPETLIFAIVANGLYAIHLRSSRENARELTCELSS